MPQYIVVCIVYLYSYTLYIGKNFFDFFEFYEIYTGLYIRLVVHACVGTIGSAYISSGLVYIASGGFLVLNGDGYSC